MRGIDVTLQLLDSGIYDIEIGWDGDLKTADTFDTYILVALFTDARANEAQVQDSSRRRGWIGNEYTPGVQMGSLLWLFEQAKLTRTVMNDVSGEVVRALQSMVDDGLALAVREAFVRLLDGGVYLEANIQRPQSQVERRYYELWQNTGVT